MDRLGELPDHILHHVLSFVDSKTTVQTSLLSRRWRPVWKSVPALNLNTKSFKPNPSFHRFVSEILSRRCDSAAVDVISLEAKTIRIRSRYSDVLPLYRRLFDYAAWHGIRRLRAVGDREGDLWIYFSREGLSSHVFRALTTLHLDGVEMVDPFADSPNLRDLTLRNCRWRSDCGVDCLRISGMQLLNFSIEHCVCSVDKVDISAPNLKTLCYDDRRRYPAEFGELHLPSLDRAYVRFPPAGDVVLRRLVKLLQGLHNATTLELHWDTCKMLEMNPKIFKVKTSHFTRLKSLIFNVQGPLDMSASLVTRYFFSNPSNK